MVISVTVAVGNVTDAVVAEGRGSKCVSTIAGDLGRDAAAERERGKGVVVRKEDDGVDELCKGPAVLLRLQELLQKHRGEKKKKFNLPSIPNLVHHSQIPPSSTAVATISISYIRLLYVHLQPSDQTDSHLHVFLGEKPRSVGQDFVEFSELLQLLWGFVQSIQPLRITPDLKEVVHVQVDQIGTLVSSCCLHDQRRSREGC